MQELSEVLYGVEHKPGMRSDRDLPLCRAEGSGARFSNPVPGDVVPNPRWMAEGRFRGGKPFPLLVEVKAVSIRPTIYDVLQDTGYLSSVFKEVSKAASKAKLCPVLLFNWRSRGFIVMTDSILWRGLGLTVPESHVSVGRKVLFLASQWKKIQTPIFSVHLNRGDTDVHSRTEFRGGVSAPPVCRRN